MKNKRYLLFVVLLVATACTQRIAIVGEGDVVSASGDRNCSLQEAPCDFDLVGDYSETYTATPRAGWQFGRWLGCLVPSGNRCTNTVAADVVNAQEGKVYSTVAVFEGEGLSNLTSNDTAKLSSILSQYSAEDKTCLTAGLGNKQSDASAVINQCIQDALPNSILRLQPGRYLLDSPLVVDKPIYLTTVGKSLASVACPLDNNASCAELLAGSTIVTEESRGFINITSANVTIGHLIINGEKEVRADSESGQTCANLNNIFGFNMSVSANNYTMFSSVTRDALCASGLVVYGPSSNHLLVNNAVAFNGVHDVTGLWADGFTVLEVSASEISRNRFINNTDIDLIFGGCQNCLIQENTIFHTDDFDGSAFAGLMLYNFLRSTSGDFTGSITSENDIDCGNKRCGFGLYIGQLSWSPTADPLFGGIVRDNMINNAMLGFNVEETTGSMSISNNQVSNSGGVHNTSCGQRQMGTHNISAGSIVDRSNDSIPDSSYTERSYAGCIPNFRANSTEGECSDSQPFPGWGEKDGMCLLSCGALGAGNAIALASACETQGLIDLGTAYDVPFCCTNPI